MLFAIFFVMKFFVTNVTSDSLSKKDCQISYRKNVENRLPQSILVVVVLGCHHPNVQLKKFNGFSHITVVSQSVSESQNFCFLHWKNWTSSIAWKYNILEISKKKVGKSSCFFDYMVWKYSANKTSIVVEEVQFFHCFVIISFYRACLTSN